MKRGLLAGTLALLAWMLLPTLADAATKAPSKAAKTQVEIYAWYADPARSKWQGVISSEKGEKCLEGRKVTLYRKDGPKLSKVGSDKADFSPETGFGVWEVPSGEPKTGSYIAKVKASKSCGGGKSKAFKFPDDQPNTKSASKEPVKIKINGWTSITGDLGVWDGPIKSDKASCLKKADVTLYLRTGEDNAAIGDADIERSGDKYEWKVVSGAPANGSEYFVLARPSKSCARAESKVFKFPQDQPGGLRKAKKPTKSKLKIKYFRNEAPQISVPGAWVGTMSSKKEACHLGRSVSLYYKDGGEKVKVGSTETFGDGGKSSTWQIPQSDPPSREYYAKAKEKGNCAAAKSKPYTYPDDQPPGRRVASAKPEKTQVLIDFYVPSETPPYWFGEVHSDKRKCFDGRKVTLYRLKRNGKRAKVGSGKSVDSPDGPYWTIPASPPKNAKYVARVDEEDGCAADESKPFKYPDDQQEGRTAARGEVQTQVEVTNYSFLVRKAGDPGFWEGVVNAKIEGCRGDRQVKMFMQKSGRDKKVGSGTTYNTDGDFSIAAPKPKKGGKYYAKVKTFMACTSAKSKTFKYPQDQPH